MRWQPCKSDWRDWAEVIGLSLHVVLVCAVIVLGDLAIAAGRLDWLVGR
jgi:hypothetical protein